MTTDKHNEEKSEDRFHTPSKTVDKLVMFKESCRLKQVERNNIEREVHKLIEDIVAEQEQLGHYYKPIYKWSWYKFKNIYKCPVCGRELYIYATTLVDINGLNTLLVCVACAYKFAVRT